MIKTINVAIWLCMAFVSSYGQSKLDSLLFLYEDQIGSDKIQTGIRISRYHDNDDLLKSLDYANEVMAFSEEFGSDNDLLTVNNRLGIVYYKLGDLSKSNDYFLEALSLVSNLSTPNLSYESRLMNNIANNYGELKQPELAVSYYKKSLLIKKQLLDSSRYSITLNNMALTYSGLHYYDSAYSALKEALKIDLLLNDKVSAAYTNGSLGEVFLDNGIEDSARYYLHQSLDFFKNIPDTPYVLAYYNQKLGETALLGSATTDAQEYFLKSLSYAIKVGAKPIQKDCYKGLERVSTQLGLYEKAYKYNQLYTAIQDTLFKEESSQKLSQIETNYQIKNKEQEISILNANAKADKYKFYAAIGAMFLVMILLGVLYYQYLFKAKANYLLKQKNNTIETQNKEIMAGVEYAKGIQEAILPDFAVIDSLYKKAFLYYKPAQVVSGDFYWVDKINGNVIIVIADGTGHGVPGAFLSVMGTSLLRQIISEERTCKPDEILNALNEKVIEALGQSKLNSSLKDGMDVAVCTYNEEKNRLAFAGAKRPVLLKNDNKVQLVKGNRVSVGGISNKNSSFDTHYFDVKEGDAIILFTDGVVDQFGGPENKKYLTKRLIELVEAGEGIDGFSSKFEQELTNWKGEVEQTDDMLLLAVVL